MKYLGLKTSLLLYILFLLQLSRKAGIFYPHPFNGWYIGGILEVEVAMTRGKIEKMSWVFFTLNNLLALLESLGQGFISQDNYYYDLFESYNMIFNEHLIFP